MKTAQEPLVSVILPVHNSEQYLRDAIQSILKQTYVNFELLILISATTNKESKNIINSFSDTRIRHIYRTNEETMPKALSLGMDEARGKYMARMDADDVSLSNRFYEQVNFLENNPDIGMVGTWIKTIGQGKSYINKYPTLPESIKTNLLFSVSFAHPTVMMKKELFDNYKLRYNGSLNHGEDYDLWTRCASCFPMANIDKVLLFYRLHKTNASRVFKNETEDIAYHSRLRLLNHLGITPSYEEKRLHHPPWQKKGEDILSFLRKEEAWLTKILEANYSTHFFSNKELHQTLWKRFYLICRFNVKEGLLVWKIYRNSHFFRTRNMSSLIQNIKLFIHCLLRR